VPEGKEFRFFDENYARGLKWYESQFRNHQGEKAVGEVATKYLSRPVVPERIKQVIPDAKLIVSLRNPTDRAFSAYGYDIKKRIHTLSFEEAIRQHYTEYIERGFYYEQIARYLQYFSRSNLLILIYEDLKKAPRAFIEDIYGFLEVDHTFVPSQLNTRRNRGIAQRNNILLDWFMLLGNKALQIKQLRRLFNRFQATKIGDAVLERTVFSQGNNDINPETRKKLKTIFHTQNEKLSDLLARDLTGEWG
jgi:hypothetical protein